MKYLHLLVILCVYNSPEIIGKTSPVSHVLKTSQNVTITNDDPCNAIPLTLGITCSGTIGSNAGATNSTVPNETCDGLNSDGDVWYTAQVGANGTLIIETNPDTLTDIGMAVYTATNCSTLTSFACVAGGNPTYPLMPYLSITTLPAGTIVYIRLWDVGNDETGDFTICAYVDCSAFVSITGNHSGCSASPVQLCATPGFASYQWVSGSTSSCINVSAVGTNTYTVTATDADGCTASSSYSVTIHPSPSFSINGPSTACPEANPQLCVSGLFNTLFWSTGATTNCISPTTSSLYSVTVTDAFGCSGSSSKSITIYPAANVHITGPSSGCDGSTVPLCADSGFTNYIWNGGDTTACILPNATGVYSVVVTNADGCMASDNFAYTRKNTPSSAITGPSSTCNSAAAQLCAPAGDSLYMWSTGSASSCISATSTGTYTVTVTGTNGCTGSSTKSVAINPSFVMNVTGPDSVCSGGNPVLCATSGNYSYSWSNGSNSRCINPTISNTYTVVATNLSNSCTKSASKTLTVFTPLNATISGPSSACIGSVAPLCASSGGTSYLWSNGKTTECVNENSNGIYSVTITDVHGCTATASHTLVFSNSFSVNITGPSKGCLGSSAILCVPSGYDTYAWSTGDTSVCINVNNAGNYSVTVHDQTGCVANSFKNITFVSPPSATITGDTLICEGTITNWCVTSGFASYTWSNGGTSECINVSADTNYTVLVTDTNGCTSSITEHLSVIGLHPNIFESNGLLICNIYDASYQYSWLINGIPANCIRDTCVPGFSGIYSVIVTDTISGCSEIGSYNYINTGISLQGDVNYATIYPNPFHGNEFGIIFKNSSGEKTSVEVFDAIGKMILKENLTVPENLYYHKILLPENSSSLYYVHISNEKGKTVKQVLHF